MQLRNILLVVAVLVFALSVSFFGQSASRQSANQSATTTGLEQVTNPTSLATTAAKVKASTQSATTTQSAATTSRALPPNAKPLPKTKPALPATTSPAAPAPTIATTPASPLDTTVGLLQGTVVNVLCTSNSSAFHSTSGSGIFIDSRGLILTAAHVTEFMLLTDYTNTKGSCIIRTGSPAENAYKVKLAYISPSWVRANAKTLVESSPTGTGEDDFAVLAITSDMNGNAVSGTHPSVSLSHENQSTSEKISIGSYGAEFLSSNQIKAALYPIIDFGTIKELFTFDTDTVDLIALGGGAAAQEGSSGGGVLNGDNELIGLITTSSTEGKITQRDLHAITPEHIRRSFKKDMDESFDSYFKSQSVTDLIAGFDEEARTLADVVVKAVSK